MFDFSVIFLRRVETLILSKQVAIEAFQNHQFCIR